MSDIFSYVSPSIAQFRAIDEHRTLHEHGDRLRGYEARDWSATPYGALKGATSFDLPRMAVKDILEAIKEKDAKKAWMKDICDRYRSPVKDQNGTNYCWINAVVRGIEVRRAMQGLPYVSLSPASVGGPIKGYRNQGGWGGEGLEYITENGVAPTADWPDNAISRSYDNAQSQASRKRFICTKFVEMEAGDDEAVWTCIVNDLPVALGIPAWGHEICGTFLVANAGKIIVGIDNSWGTDWGDNGRGLLTGRYATFDDACSPVNCGASAA